MNIDERIALIKEVGEEIVSEEELKTLLETKKKPIAYDGFEPSGNPHIAQGVLRAINVNKMIKAGIHFKMYAADWHAWTNLKFNGNLELIQKAGDYLVEVWKACGMDTDKVEFIRAVDVIDNQEYWKKVVKIASNVTVNRVLRCGQIMGRSEDQVQQASQILYPCMQAADIFEFEADIAQLGMDQRKVNVLAREVGPKLGFWKPVIVSHHMLMGLGEPPAGDKTVDRAIEMKMSKSNPDSAIFMEDTDDDIKRKIKKAYCPEGVTEENPILEYCKYILFEKFDIIKIERPEKFGGNLEFTSYQELEETYGKKELHPMDLKAATTQHLIDLITPVRKKIESNKKMMDILEEIREYQKGKK